MWPAEGAPLEPRSHAGESGGPESTPGAEMPMSLRLGVGARLKPREQLPVTQEARSVSGLSPSEGRGRSQADQGTDKQDC